MEKGSSKERFKCGRLKSRSACEACTGGTVGCDTEQEQETPECDRLWPETHWEPDDIWAPRAIMGHVPPCIQHPHEQADRHDAGVPSTISDTGKEPHRPMANSSVQKKPLITIL